MKYVFLASFAVMLLFSAVAWLWQPGARTDGRIELTWVTDDNPVRREQIELFNRLYPKYHLHLDPQNREMEKVIVQCLAGVGPDVFDCYSGFELGAYVRSGIALDCTEEIKARGIDIDAIWPCLKPLVIHDGRVYGHPGNAGGQALWYNKALFDAAGEPYPTGNWTWPEFIEVAKRLTKRDDRGRPIQFGLMMGLGDWMEVFLGQWGAHVYTPESTRSALDSPEAGAAIDFYKDLMYKYRIAPTPTEELAMASTGGWGSGTIDLFGAGRAAMATGGRWWLCILRKPDYSKLRLGAVELPRGPVKTTIGLGRSTLINAKSKNIEGALTFLEYLHGPHWNNLVNKQADAIGGVMKYSYTPEFAFNPEHPEEDYNVVWRSALEKTVANQISPYVNGNAVDRLLWKQTDLVRANLKTGADAMRDSAKGINEIIIEQLKIDPVLRERYYEELKNGARPAWDSEAEAP